jgi:hypothetical protein
MDLLRSPNGEAAVSLARPTPGWLAGCLGLAAFAYQVSFPRVLGRADESIILYGAQRLLQGQVLYRDVFEFITPGSFYFFAGIFAVTGPSLLAARVAMAAANALACGLLFFLARRVSSALEATVAVIAFAATCLPIWPYASPHWLSTLLCLSTAAVLLAPGWHVGRPLRALSAGALAGLTFSVQQHRGVFLGIWVIAATCVLALASPDPRPWVRWRRQLGWLALGAGAVAFTVLGHAVWRASLQEVIYATFLFVLQNYRTSASLVPMPWAGICGLCGGFVPYAWMPLLRRLPTVLLAEGLLLSWTLRRHRSENEALRGCVLLLAVLMALSVLYYPDFIHVAFIAPFALIVLARLAFALRNLRWCRDRAMLRVAARALLAGCALMALLKGLGSLQHARLTAPLRFDSAVGPLRGGREDRMILQAVQRLMERYPVLQPTLFSYPPEAWLYLASGADNPTPFSLLQPGYNSPTQFRQVIDTLAARPPDYVVISLPGLRRSDPVVQSLLPRYREIESAGSYRLYVRR